MGSTSPSPLDPSLLKPSFPPGRAPSSTESPAITSLLQTLNLQPHIEGGYFAETDRDARRIPNPFAYTADSNTEALSSNRSGSRSAEAATRSASTSIFYLLTPDSPLGAFHRNRGRTVHTLHKGRARYVILHADEVAGPDFPGGYGGGDGLEKPAAESNEARRWVGKVRVEVFTVGQNVEKGEKLQWIVEGGKYKASFLLPDDAEGENVGDGGVKRRSAEGCLISETVVPGFEYADHDFMVRERFDVLVPDEWKKPLEWMLRKV